jgi:ribosomal protein L11 methyltransferase
MANINRNILLKDIPLYAKALNENGALFLSGFYEQDIKPINESCEKCMLKLDETLKRGDWVSVKFIN